jgi:hypothetical protein
MRITLLAGTLRTRLAETRQADSHHQPPRRVVVACTQRSADTPSSPAPVFRNDARASPYTGRGDTTRVRRRSEDVEFARKASGRDAWLASGPFEKILRDAVAAVPASALARGSRADGEARLAKITEKAAKLETELERRRREEAVEAAQADLAALDAR